MNKSALIVIVEDEEDLLEILEYNLQKAGYDTMGFLSVKGVEQAIEEEDVALLIMDRNLPGVEGSEFITSLRKKNIETPVIYLTAKDSEKDLEDGFLSGADDYMTKPFKTKELLFRIKAILKRTHNEEKHENVSYRDITLNLSSRKVYVGDDEIDLTKLEFDLLYTFVSNKNIVLNRDILLEKVWGNDEVYQDKTVNVAINRLKDKIDPKKEKNYIKAVRGVGYTLV